MPTIMQLCLYYSKRTVWARNRDLLCNQKHSVVLGCCLGYLRSDLCEVFEEKIFVKDLFWRINKFVKYPTKISRKLAMFGCSFNSDCEQVAAAQILEKSNNRNSFFCTQGTHVEGTKPQHVISGQHDPGSQAEQLLGEVWWPHLGFQRSRTRFAEDGAGYTRPLRTTARQQVSFQVQIVSTEKNLRVPMLLLGGRQLCGHWLQCAAYFRHRNSYGESRMPLPPRFWGYVSNRSFGVCRVACISLLGELKIVRCASAVV